MFVKTFPVGSFQCNCTILGDETTGVAIVIDPGGESQKILSALAQKGFTVKYLLHAHAHLDHIGATKAVKDATGASIGLHKEDLFLYDNIAMQGQLLGVKLDPHVCPVDHYLIEGDVIEWGNQNRIEILHTPGHTPGSLTFLAKKLSDAKDVLFAGDTLFLGSIGRTDLWGGDYDQILDSIKNKILNLDDTISVVCGHGPNTNIGRERKANPFLLNL